MALGVPVGILKTGAKSGTEGSSTSVSIPWVSVLRASNASKEKIRAAKGKKLFGLVVKVPISKECVSDGARIPARSFKLEDGKPFDVDGDVVWLRKDQ